MKLEEKVVRQLKKERKRVSVAESCTGGLLAQRLTSVPGASSVFEYGVITYSGTAKGKLLKVPTKVMKAYGQVSKEVAVAMARGIQRLSKSYYAIGVTGIAGPSGGTKQKPVGTVYLSLISKNGTHIKKLQLSGSRIHIQRKTTTIALNWLYDFLTKK